MKLKLTLAYDGRAWRGWQSQARGETIQDRIEAAFITIIGHRIVVNGSGRTDAGVHARAQVAHVDVPENTMTPEIWQRALNANLPVSIRVLACEPAASDFHARFDATGKIYHYRIWRSDLMNPFEAGLAWHIHGPLDMDLLKAGAHVFCGTHNFTRLSANRGERSEIERREDLVAVTRTIRRIDIHQPTGSELLTLEFEGDGFLYKMVRLLTGSLVHAARGRADILWLRDLIENPLGLKSNHCAPPDGLYLDRVLY
ncbi:tRNA pseudouridine(38-40) synthase TruA [Phragmitibacter flavus]|uniref:tRNA pseudouridine synthase A n=1 Tax=Phragmitibacter flavus TaxID=2576071 RepID=A0A5R8KJ85_9BACT|nr:tRNA pseudouridine(38-40) synthase TruA [Phragmitibacter flavus]TLD72383.1 tRNA pseudouridine(38-40) synthase TruA [Phragmitibacter flavus]